jgi:hypothetical protein
MIKLKNLVKEVFDANLLEEEQKFKIFCDMDGVLVDFEKGVEQLTGGLSFRTFEKSKSSSGKDGTKEIFNLINTGGSIWWATLPWMKDGKILWNFIKNRKPTILTAGSRKYCGDISEKGKKDWVLKNLGANVEVIVVDGGVDKQRYAQANYILIDDYTSNIREWNNAGGIGILHTNSQDTINKLQQILGHQ